MSEESEDKPIIDPLIVMILEQQHKDSTFVTNALIESYKRDKEFAEASLIAIRKRMELLFSGPYAPSQNMIMSTLYPSHQIIDEYREGGRMHDPYGDYL